jgi:hypothetical protein
VRTTSKRAKRQRERSVKEIKRAKRAKSKERTGVLTELDVPHLVSIEDLGVTSSMNGFQSTSCEAYTMPQ